MKRYFLVFIVFCFCCLSAKAEEYSALAAYDEDGYVYTNALIAINDSYIYIYEDTISSYEILDSIEAKINGLNIRNFICRINNDTTKIILTNNKLQVINNKNKITYDIEKSEY